MIELTADRCQITGPRSSDGTYKVMFEFGEYMAEQVAELLKIPQGTTIKVKVEYDRT